MRSSRHRFLVPLTGVVAALAAVALLGPGHLAAGAEATPAASYVGSTLCKGCHSPLAQGWADTAHGKALADPQLPESQRDCEACHGPGSLHAQSAGKTPLRNPVKLPAAEASALCGACHFDAGTGPANAPKLAVAPWKRSGHARGEKSCTACHTVHGTGQHALKAAPAQLCATCHSDLTKAPAGGTVHAPVAAGQCLLCHDPHGTAGPHSVKPTVSAACESCHSPTVAKMKTAHKGYQVAGADCTRCHDPHSFAADKAYLRTATHPPFAQGNCQLCHVDPPSTALKKPVADTCFTCHPKSSVLPQTGENDLPMHAHPPVEVGMCTKCHEPHASPAKGSLLRDDEGYVCTACHKTIGTALIASHQHPPVSKGDCMKCHAGHGSVQPALLRKEQSALCQECHKDQAMHAHPTGPTVKDPNSGKPLTCASCHSLHGSEFAAILPQEETSLCLTCHRMPQ